LGFPDVRGHAGKDRHLCELRFDAGNLGRVGVTSLGAVARAGDGNRTIQALTSWPPLISHAWVGFKKRQFRLIKVANYNAAVNDKHVKLLSGVSTEEVFCIDGIANTVAI